jgi:hypothetical protein
MLPNTESDNTLLENARCKPALIRVESGCRAMEQLRHGHAESLCPGKNLARDNLP